MGEKLVFHPIVFWSKSFDLGGFREQIAPSAVERTLREKHDVRALIGHDVMRPIGRVSAGTLRLTTDTRGLRAEVDMPNATYARDAMEQIRRGDAPGASFAFTTISDSWVMSGDTPLRTLTDVEIRECSAAVCWPAYVATEETASRYGRVAYVEESGTGISDRAWARKFAAEFRKLAADTPGLEVRVSYDGEYPRMTPYVHRGAYRPSLSLCKARLRLAKVAV